MSNAFLIGSYQFNNSPLYNFQLNRVVLWNHGDPAEVAARGKEITDFASWERVLKELSYQAERRKDWAAAAGYLRMAEFFMVPDTPESRDVYDYSILRYCQNDCGHPCFQKRDSGDRKRYHPRQDG